MVVGFAAEARVARRLAWPVATGGGTNAGAADAAERLVRQGAQALVSFGLAGGVAPDLHPGALLVPHTVCTDDLRFPTDPNLSQLLGGTTPHVLYGANVVIATRAAKHAAFVSTQADAVDLESGAVARVAAIHHLPFAVLRAICDPAERDVPAAALTALDAQGGLATWRVLRSLAAEPRQLPALFALAVDAVMARRALIARVRQIQRTGPDVRPP